MLIMGKSAGPEATLRTPSSIIHPGSVWRGRDELTQPAARRQIREPAVRGKQPSLIIIYRRDRTHCAADLIAAHRDKGAIRCHLVAVDAAGQNVDPEQLAATVVPPGSLAELALFGGAGDWVACHCGLPLRKSMMILMSSGPFLSASGQSSGVTRRVMSCASQPGSACASASAAWS